MTRTLALSGALLALALTAASAQQVTGSVYVDANGNGKRDSNERGIAGVAVSNQDTVVTTDASGAFRIPRGPSNVVFVSVPDGYRSHGAFWRSIADTATSISFALTATGRVRQFSFVHASDTHISPASVERTKRLGALVDSLSPAFLIVTGDLVRDALRVGEPEATSYYELFAQETSAFHTPMWTVPGNHENFGIERDKSHVSATNPLYGRGMYHRYFGPDYYSFNYGGVHFIGLNTADIEDQWYYGHVDSLQLAWLARDLALVPSAMPVVTFDHIPFVSTIEGLNGYMDGPPAPSLITVRGKTVYRHTVSNAGDVLRVLRKRNHVLALGGHFHAAEKVAYEIEGQRTRFNLAAAIIGPTNSHGLVFPSGVTLYTVRDGVIDEGKFVPLGITERVTP
ncbi:MAG TPA: metallophosphoesterase [Gemmatimonadaceae bacterium]|nr:metallophosphoesterase [Gemmatimonadaceae bacterium]